MQFLEIHKEKILYIIFAFIFLGFYLPRALLSVATILLFAYTLFNPNFKKHFSTYFKMPVFWSFFALFILYWVGGFWSEDLAEFFNKMRGKLALVAFSFGCMPLLGMKKNFTEKIYALFVLSLFIVGIYTAADYFINYDLRTQNTQLARYTYSPINHIILSLLVVNSIYILLYFLFNRFYTLNLFKKSSIIFLVVFFIFLLHLNAARTGILALYFTASVFAIKYILVKKQYTLGITLLLSTLLIPVFSYFTIPSFKDKVNYTLYDFKQFENVEQVKNYSDAQRIAGYHLAWRVFKNNPVLGCGTGDINKLSALKIDKKYEIDNVHKLLPHNQFIYMAVILGVVGLICFIYLIFKMYPLKLLLKNDLLIASGSVNFITLLPESILETQLGIVCFCIFTLLAHCYFYQKK